MHINWEEERDERVPNRERDPVQRWKEHHDKEVEVDDEKEPPKGKEGHRAQKSVHADAFGI